MTTSNHEPLFQRFKFAVQYDGTKYNGFQKQTTTQNTIQEKLESAFHQLQFPNDHLVNSSSMQHLKKSLICSSRTDKGVHAIKNTCHIDLCVNFERRKRKPLIESTSQYVSPEQPSIEQEPQFTVTSNSLFSNSMKMKNLLNYYLKDETIRILEIESVPSSYHCKKNVLHRLYMYRMIDHLNYNDSPISMNNSNNHNNNHNCSSNTSTTDESLMSSIESNHHTINSYNTRTETSMKRLSTTETSSVKNNTSSFTSMKNINSTKKKNNTPFNATSSSNSSDSNNSNNSSSNNSHGGLLKCEMHSTLFPLESYKLWCISEKLNIHAMKQACQYFIGTHNMTCFSSSTFSFQNPKKKISPMKTIQEMYIQQEIPNLFISASNEYRIFIKSKSFMKHQIRFMIQVLVKIGRNELPPECIQEYLQSSQRVESTKNMAPAHGLYLVDVVYATEEESSTNDDSDEFSD